MKINIAEECKAIRKRTRDLEKLGKTNPEAAKNVAREFLIKAGIYTKAGNLKRAYGGLTKQPKKSNKDVPVVSREQFDKLIEDPKTNWNILFEQMMDQMCDTDYDRYLKLLKFAGDYIDEARIGHGFKMKWKL